MPRLVLCFFLLAGVFGSLHQKSAAQARQVELMRFDAAADGVVLEVGQRLPPTSRSSPVNEGTPVALNGLREDFALMVPPTEKLRTEFNERSAIPIPLWIRTGETTASAFRTAPTLYDAGLGIPACSLLPYRPRGDLPVLVERRRANLYPLITAVACEAGVPTGLLDALIAQESRYDPVVVSPKGAVGLTQLMPGTAALLGVIDARNPLQNLRGGARYLRSHLDEFRRVDLALAAYNAGPGRVRTRGRIPAFAETVGYVSAVLRGWNASAFGSSVGRAAFGPAPLVPRGVQLLAITPASSPLRQQ